MSTQLHFFEPAPQALPDVCSRKHGGNKQSEAANRKAQPYKASMAERIRIWIMGCGYPGATSEEIEAYFNLPKNKFSGRLTELRKEEVIFASSRIRRNCTVFVGRKEWAK